MYNVFVFYVCLKLYNLYKNSLKLLTYLQTVLLNDVQVKHMNLLLKRRSLDFHYNTIILRSKGKCEESNHTEPETWMGYISEHIKENDYTYYTRNNDRKRNRNNIGHGRSIEKTKEPEITS